MQIHQILPTISYGDAIGNDVLEIKAALETWGFKSEIFAQHIHPKLSHIAKPYTEYLKFSSPENILIFHFSIGSDLSGFVKTLPDKKILIYHNITPYSYFKGINDILVNLCINGRKELAEYSNLVNLALGDSEYNRMELEELGFKNTGVLPIIVDFESYEQEPDHEILKKFNDDFTNFIFVGRISPNKKQEDIIRTFYYYNKCIDPKSRLFLVGSYDGMEKYYELLEQLVKRLNLNNVYITGQVNFKELLAYYKLADIFISMSEHEGFCVPLLESMYFGIPIVAYNSTAIPYTLDHSGLLFNEKRYDEVGELVNILLKSQKLKNKIIQKQKARLKEFDESKITRILRGYIEQVIH
ncbi:MAG: glycosyltransferase [Candidatus Methanoperedens sp.]|nr:glycosyltransferase [Candidatus Methanoperedens sp.]